MVITGGTARRHVANIFEKVGAANRVYITDRDGTTLVLSHEDHPKTLASNHLNDRFSASAAVVDRELYLR